MPCSPCGASPNASVAWSRWMAWIARCCAAACWGCRRQRLGQEHALAHHRRRGRARRGHHGDGGRGVAACISAGGGAERHHHRPSACEPGARHARLENVFLWRRALWARWFRQPRRRPPPRGRPVGGPWQLDGYPSAGGAADGGRAAARGDRPRACPQSAPADPRRADRRAGGRRGREAVCRHPPADGARHRRHLISTGSARSSRSATTSW